MAANHYTLAPRPVRSTASVISIVSAIGSFVLSGRGHPLWAIAVAVIGISCGAFGLVRSISPHVKGGVLSTVAMVLSIIAVLVAIIATLMQLLR